MIFFPYLLQIIHHHYAILHSQDNVFKCPNQTSLWMLIAHFVQDLTVWAGFHSLAVRCVGFPVGSAGVSSLLPSHRNLLSLFRAVLWDSGKQR